MKNKIKALLIAVFLLSFHFSYAQDADSAETTARRQFLFRLGFNDIPKEIRGRIERKEYKTELNRRQMLANATAYETINASRELALFIMSEAGIDRSNLNSSKAQRLAMLTAKMLALKPLAPATDYPSAILNMPEGDKREEVLVNWLHDTRIRQMNSEKDRILSDFVSALYHDDIVSHKAEILKMDKLLTTIVERMYMDDTIGNGKYFGRALLALMAREEALNSDKGSKLKETIATELKTRYNLYIENFIGDTIIIDTGKGPQKITVENGTMMASRNLETGSLQISWGAIPGNLVDRWRARFKGLIGTPLAGFFYVTPEDTGDGISLWMRIRDRIAQFGWLREGYSHIVYYQMKEDAETGIKMPRVVDNYPNKVADTTEEYVRTGGTRFTYLEQVVDFSHHSAVYIANPDAEKLQAWSQKNMKENGYQKEFYPSIDTEMHELAPQKNDKVVLWQTDISESTFDRVHSEKDPVKLKKDLMQRFADGLEQTVYDGWIFHWMDPYDFALLDAAYCSKTGDAVARKYLGMPLEEHGSEWHWMLRFFGGIGKIAEDLQKNPKTAKIGDRLMKLPGVEKSRMLTKMTIISPTTLVLEPFMKGQAYVFPTKTLEQRVQSSYLTDDYRESDPKLTVEIHRALQLTRYESGSRDFVLDYGAAMRDFDYGIVMRASRGVKTQGFSPDTMAEIGSKKEAVRRGLIQQPKRALKCSRAHL